MEVSSKIHVPAALTQG